MGFPSKAPRAEPPKKKSQQQIGAERTLRILERGRKVGRCPMCQQALENTRKRMVDAKLEELREAATSPDEAFKEKEGIYVPRR
ncbi:MAG: hypothetical protein JSV79_03830 [Armatimonadota bacterium]|nr:MAG: hypothetical protein JSV79_03830 [Armatimonadota bacterium]